MKLKIKSKSSSTVTVNTHRLLLGDTLLIYTEYINDKGKMMDCSLRDVNGEEINDPVLLEQVQNFLDSFDEDEKRAAEDADEELRRAEKHGLYGGEVDIAN